MRQFNELRARNQLLDAVRATVEPAELERLMKEGRRLTADDAAWQALEG